MTSLHRLYCLQISYDLWHRIILLTTQTFFASNTASLTPAHQSTPGPSQHRPFWHFDSWQLSSQNLLHCLIPPAIWQHWQQAFSITEQWPSSCIYNGCPILTDCINMSPFILNHSYPATHNYSATFSFHKFFKQNLPPHDPQKCITVIHNTFRIDII